MSNGMGLLEAAFMGLVQGLTEFLPISSSAHIRILGDLTGEGEPGAAFTAMIQIGTELAVLLYFRHDIARIVVAWVRALAGAYGSGWRARVGLGAAVGPTSDLVDTAPAGSPTGRGGRGGTSHDALMGWFIIVGSIPIVVLGLLFKDSIESTLRNLWLTVIMLSVFALLLGWADKVGEQRRTMEDLTVRHALFFGLWQALALIPGVSRSGGTITGGRFMGYTREAAARYSFLLAMPAVFGAGLLELVSSLGDFGKCTSTVSDEAMQAALAQSDSSMGLPTTVAVEGVATYTPSIAATLVATAVAFVVGYVVIIGFLKIVSTYSYKPFVYYRLALAAVVALLLLTGVMEPTPTVTYCSG